MAAIVITLLTLIFCLWATALPSWADKMEAIKFQGIPLSCYVSVTEKFAEGNSRAFSLSEIASKYIDAKANEQAVALLDKAIEVLKATEENSPKAYLMVEIADHYAQAGQKQQAAATLNKAFTLVKGFTNPVDRVFATVKIARAFYKLGEEDKANRLLKQALLPTKDLTDVYIKSRAYEAIASGLIEAGDLPAASQALEQGRQYAGMPLDPASRARALIEVAAVYAELKDHGKAIEALQNAFKQLEAEIPEEYKADFNARAFALMVERYLATDQPDTAKDVLTNIPDQSIEKSIGLLNLSSRYRKDNQLEPAKTAIAQSLEKVSALPDSLDKSAVLAEISAGYRLLGDESNADKALSASAQVAEKLVNPLEKIYALTTIASQYANNGNHAQAQQYLDKALAIVDSTDPDKPFPNRDRALSDIAGIYWQIGKTDTAQAIAEKITTQLEKDQLTALFACAGTETASASPTGDGTASRS